MTDQPAAAQPLERTGQQRDRSTQAMPYLAVVVRATTAVCCSR
jgi:hypothetical protein